MCQTLQKQGIQQKGRLGHFKNSSVKIVKVVCYKKPFYCSVPSIFKNIVRVLCSKHITTDLYVDLIDCVFSEIHETSISRKSAPCQQGDINFNNDFVECYRNKIKAEMEKKLNCSTAYFEDFKLDR